MKLATSRTSTLVNTDVLTCGTLIHANVSKTKKEKGKVQGKELEEEEGRRKKNKKKRRQ